MSEYGNWDDGYTDRVHPFSDNPYLRVIGVQIKDGDPDPMTTIARGMYCHLADMRKLCLCMDTSMRNVCVEFDFEFPTYPYADDEIEVAKRNMSRFWDAVMEVVKPEWRPYFDSVRTHGHAHIGEVLQALLAYTPWREACQMAGRLLKAIAQNEIHYRVGQSVDNIRSGLDMGVALYVLTHFYAIDYTNDLTNVIDMLD